MKKALLLILLSLSPLYALDISAQLTVCATCHGEKGISQNPVWPNLAGQHQSYLLKQLKDYKEGRRFAPSMPSLVAALSDEELNALSHFFSTQTNATGTVPKAYLKRGQALYRGGDFKKHITACISCHGPKGEGNGEAGFPVLSGQQAEYTILQLKAFKEDKRSNDINHIMRDIAKHMSDDDIEAVAHYTQGLY